MEKQTRIVDIDYNLDWDYNVSIKEIRDDLDAIEKMGATHVNILPPRDSWSSMEIEAVCERLETDEEYQERNEELERRERQQKEKDLAELNRLKAKYEK